MDTENNSLFGNVYDNVDVLSKKGMVFSIHLTSGLTEWANLLDRDV